MHIQTGHKAFPALIAALCFAILSGLHIARPLTPITVVPSELASFGFTVDDICGYGENGGNSSSCPNCTLVENLVLLASSDLLDWTPAVSGLESCPYCTALHHASRPLAYKARAPPVFT
ncbi:hypothetical protein [Shimia sp.]|uniref:hypothetical protein n=1 Tax=Shimia sp. TaxID=1954381 RepID=UPI00329854A1